MKLQKKAVKAVAVKAAKNVTAKASKATKVETVEAVVDVMQKQSDSFRKNIEQKGVALMASGSYVATRFNRSACDKSIAHYADKTLRFGAEWLVAVASGEKAGRGSVGRFAQETANGQVRRYLNGNVLDKDVVLVETSTVRDYVEAAIKRNELVTVTKKKSGVSIVGFLMGSIGDAYAHVVYALSGRVQLADIETRANAYNAKEIVTLGDKAKVVSQAASIAKELRAAVNATAKGAKAVTAK